MVFEIIDGCKYFVISDDTYPDKIVFDVIKEVSLNHNNIKEIFKRYQNPPRKPNLREQILYSMVIFGVKTNISAILKKILLVIKCQFIQYIYMTIIIK